MLFRSNFYTNTCAIFLVGVLLQYRNDCQSEDGKASRGVIAVAIPLPTAYTPGARIPPTEHLVSWQYQEPALTGIATAMTLGMWPDHYGGDAQLVRAPKNLHEARNASGWSELQFHYLKPHAEAIYRTYKHLTFAVLGLGMVFLIFSRVRKKRTR
jgi:hypothetical protein